LVQTPEDRPYSVELAIAMASSSEAQRITGETGPKVSVLTTGMSGVT
jgi:hypothetical protein